MSDSDPNNQILSRLGMGKETKHSLLTILSTLLTRPPRPRNKRIASSTTARAAKKFRSTCNDGEMIVGVVLYPGLIDRSVRLASDRAQNHILDEADCCDVVFMTYISPHLTPSFCSPELFSEYDSREYSGIGLIRPALAAMHIADEGVPSSVLKRSGQTSFGPGRPVTWPVGRVKIRPGQVRPTSGQVTGQGYAITFVTCDDLG